MIKELYIDNFKSLINFRLQLTQFTCLIGLNGSGKSTILQAIDFISQLAQGSLDDWLEVREWQPTELASQLQQLYTIFFKVKFQVDGILYTWEGQVDLETLICTTEIITSDGLLRLLTILSQMMTNHAVLLFDEIEDGINPELIEALVDLLVTAQQQVIITTHSPMIFELY